MATCSSRDFWDSDHNMFKLSEECDNNVKAIDSYISHSQSFIQDVRSFMRERSEIERQYSKQVKALTEKYSKETAKSNIFGVTNQEHGSQESAIRAAFSSLLTELENSARNRLQYADLVVLLENSAKSISIRKEEARKRQYSFLQKMEQERLAFDEQVWQTRQDYLQSCNQVHLAQEKLKKIPGTEDLKRDKTRKQLHQLILDMRNCKNVYILQIESANHASAKFQESLFPRFLQDLRQFARAICDDIKGIFHNYCSLELDMLSKNIDQTTNATKNSDKINSAEDVDMFLGRAGVVADSSAPPDHVFESTVLWKDLGELSKDEYSKSFLKNLLQERRQQSRAIDATLTEKFKLLDDSKDLEELHTGSESEFGGTDKEWSRELSNTIDLLNFRKLNYDSQICMLTSNLPVPTTPYSYHKFETKAFPIPTSCDYCSMSIWGMAKPGIFCKICGYHAHTRCQMKIPPECLSGNRAQSKRSSSSGSASKASSSDSSSTASLSKITEKAVVLFDYSASVDEGYEEYPELTVHAGDVVFIIHHDDGNGWSLVSLQEKIGHVPKSFLSVKNQWKRKSLVKYDFDRTCAEELSVRQGDKVQVICDEGDGWLRILASTGQQGLVPASYIN